MQVSQPFQHSWCPDEMPHNLEDLEEYLKRNSLANHPWEVSIQKNVANLPTESKLSLRKEHCSEVLETGVLLYSLSLGK